ncbi:MAG: Ig-like domain-containing protein [Clostridia bacterium]|nr:Ig-like domain-containing protein [Clostridia bacterium]
MKNQALTKTLSVILSALMLIGIMPFSALATTEAEADASTPTCVVTVTDPVESNYMLLSARDLVDCISYNQVSASSSLVDCEDLEKIMLRTEVTSDGVMGDGVSLLVSLENAGIPAKKFPFIRIAYRTKIASPSPIDFNLCVDKYNPRGGTDSVAARLWGYTPAYNNTGEYTNLDFDASAVLTGGDTVGTPYNWDYVADDGIYTTFWLKLWGGQSGTAPTAGDYFEIEYIAFFDSQESMDTFEYSNELVSLSVDESISVEQMASSLIGVEFFPASAYAKLTYTSDNESIAKVTPDGRVIGIGEGTANITVATADGKHSGVCKVTVSAASKDYSNYIIDRGNLENLVYRLNTDKELNVVYLGGSVTVGAGASNANLTSWRALTGKWLQDFFPDAKVSLYNSAIGGSGSMHGAFRTDVDVLAHDPDLVFVEFAVNDNYSSHYTDGTVQLYYESILRQIREKSPNTEIIAVYTADQTHLNNTSMHEVAVLQDEVAAHYGVSSIDVGLALCNHIVATDAEWSDYIADFVHPKDAGYAIYANAIEQYLFEELLKAGYDPTSLTKHSVPETYVDERGASFKPKYVTVSEDIFDDLTGWTYNSGKVPQYPNVDCAGYISPTSDTNSFTYTFEGTGLSMFMEFYGGKYYLKWSIDGGEPTTLYITDTNHAFNKMCKTGTLENGKHTITFSYMGADGTGGTNDGVMVTRMLVSKIPTDEDDILYGDVDGNGKVEPSDSVTLSRYNAKWTGYSESDINMANADVNGVSGVDSSDAVALARYLAQWSGYETLPLTPNE